jgi:hypothetical protein
MEKGMVYNIPCESDEEGHKHIYTGKEKFLYWFSKLGGQVNSAKILSLSFKIYS